MSQPAGSISMDELNFTSYLIKKKRWNM